MKERFPEKTAVAVGKFDGLHLGHRILLSRIAELAKDGLTPLVVTVEESPVHEGLLTLPETDERLRSLGIFRHERLFLSEIREMPAEDFLREILVGQYHAAFVAAGTDFRFGKDRTGDASVLKQAGRELGFRAEIFEKLKIGGEDVSSARIKKALQSGDPETAALLLGEPYTIHVFPVCGGMGVYAANPAKILPAAGKYRVSYSEESGETFTEAVTMPNRQILLSGPSLTVPKTGLPVRFLSRIDK